LLPRIIVMAFERPARTITDIAQHIGATYQAASNNVATLVKADIAPEGGSHPMADSTATAMSSLCRRMIDDIMLRVKSRADCT